MSCQRSGPFLLFFGASAAAFSSFLSCPKISISSRSSRPSPAKQFVRHMFLLFLLYCPFPVHTNISNSLIGFPNLLRQYIRALQRYDTVKYQFSRLGILCSPRRRSPVLRTGSGHTPVPVQMQAPDGTLSVWSENWGSDSDFRLHCIHPSLHR